MTYTRDKSYWVKKNISSLLNNVVTAIVLVFIVLISILGIFLIERSVDIQDYFRKGNPARTAENIMINKFGG